MVGGVIRREDFLVLVTIERAEVLVSTLSQLQRFGILSHGFARVLKYRILRRDPFDPSPTTPFPSPENGAEP